MKVLPAPDLLLRQWLHHPHAVTVAAFAIAAIFLGVAARLVLRNLRYNEPGLRAPVAFLFALFVAAAGLFGAHRLPAPWGLIVAGTVCVLAGLFFLFAPSTHRQPHGTLAGKVEAIRCSGLIGGVDLRLRNRGGGEGARG